MRNLRYDARLTKWEIKRRVRGGLIKMYKSENGLDEINWERDAVINTPTDRLLTGSNGEKIRRDTFKSKIHNGFAK